MSLQHSFLVKGLASWGIALALAGGSVFAQEGIVALSPAVELDEGGACAFAPSALETEGRTVAVWKEIFSDQGIFARSGPSLDQLGPEVELNSDFVQDEVRIAPQPGGFVAAWIRQPTPQAAELVFRRFDAGLSALAPEVVVGPAFTEGSPALLANADGTLTLAYYDPDGKAKVRRYSAADAPLAAAVDGDPLVTVDASPQIRLVARDSGFVAAWSGFRSGESPKMWLRPFDEDGAPAAASKDIGSGGADFDLAWVPGSYLLVQADGSHVRGSRLDENGELVEVSFDLPADDAHDPRLVAGGGALELVFVDHEIGLVGLPIELPSFAADSGAQLLVPQPADGQSFIHSSTALPSPEGFLAAWQMAGTFTIPHPCQETRSIHAQAFGPPRGVVDVPTVAPPGLLVLALLTAAGALILLRGTDRM